MSNAPIGGTERETMTEISVSGLIKSFEIGNNILDGITFQVETG